MVDPTVYTKLFAFSGALSALAMAASGWWRKDGPTSDEMVSEACDLLIDSIADADAVSEINAKTGVNVRDQLTVGDLEDMRREAELRKFGRRN